jgi:hypothetical protein
MINGGEQEEIGNLKIKMKKIKLFENYSSENYEREIEESIYEKWSSRNGDSLYLLESMGSEEEDSLDWLDDEDLTPGEMRALERDLQVISKEQLAALYLKALGQYEFGDPERMKGRRSKSEVVQEDVYVTGIPGIEEFCSEDWKSGKLFIGPSALSDAIGLRSLGTVTRTVNKFRLLLDGESEGRYDEVVYPKVINAFDFFKGKSPEVIQGIAAEGIQNPETSKEHRSVLKGSGISKADSLIIGKLVHSLFKDYMSNSFFRKNVCKAQSSAISSISKSKRISPEELETSYKNYLISQKMLDKFNWCGLYSKYGIY